MLVLKRREGQWVEIIHEESGDVLRVRIYNIMGESGERRADVCFDDQARNFRIERPERGVRGPHAGARGASRGGVEADEV